MTKTSLRLLAATVAVGAAAALTGCTPASSTTSGSSTSPKAGKSSSGSSSPSANGKPSDGGWTLASWNFKDNGLGDFGGTARITNTEDSSRTGLFTITVFKGDDQVATLSGSASDVESGSTSTVQLISTDKYVSGPYRVEFQNDL